MTLLLLCGCRRSGSARNLVRRQSQADFTELAGFRRRLA